MGGEPNPSHNSVAGPDWCPPVLLILVPQPLCGSRGTVCLASEGHSEEKTDYPGSYVSGCVRPKSVGHLATTQLGFLRAPGVRPTHPSLQMPFYGREQMSLWFNPIWVQVFISFQGKSSAMPGTKASGDQSVKWAPLFLLRCGGG